MKFYIIILMLTLAKSNLFAQTCQQIEIANTSQKNSLLKEYIKDCKQKHYFFEDKGAVKLVIYQDAEGITCWHLSAIIDDRYRAIPTQQYSFLGNDVILVYNGDHEGNPIPVPGNTSALDSCIQNILGSRVYEQSNKKQFVYFRNQSGVIQKIPVTHVLGGNLSNSLIIKFNKNGTLSKIIPV